MWRLPLEVGVFHRLTVLKSIAWAAGLVLLAGCGGGGSSSSTPVTVPTSTPVPQPLTPQGPLLVAGLNQVVAFPIGALGTASAKTVIEFGVAGDANPPWTLISAIGSGPVASVIIGSETFRSGGEGGTNSYACTLEVYSANAPGSSNWLSSPACSGDLYPSAIFGRSNGDIDYLAQPYSGQNQIVRIRASDGTSIVRLTAAPGDTFSAFTEDATGNIYVIDGPAVKEYGGASDVASAAPVRSVPLSFSASKLAVAYDGTIYAAPTSAGAVEALAPTGATRTVGPFAGKSIGAIATDSAGGLYVGLNGGGTTEVDVFAANATGNSPVHVVSNPIGGYPANAVAQITGIAIGQ